MGPAGRFWSETITALKLLSAVVVVTTKLTPYPLCDRGSAMRTIWSQSFTPINYNITHYDSQTFPRISSYTTWWEFIGGTLKIYKSSFAHLYNSVWSYLYPLDIGHGKVPKEYKGMDILSKRTKHALCLDIAGLRNGCEAFFCLYCTTWRTFNVKHLTVQILISCCW